MTNATGVTARQAAIRPAVAGDLPSIVAVFNRAHHWDAPASAEIIEWLLARADPTRPHPHVVASVGGRIVGTGFVRGIPELDPLVLNLDVEPSYQRQGIGTALFRRLLDLIADEPRLVMTVSESSAGGVAFAAHHTFREVGRRYESELDLRTFDPTAFARDQHRLLRSGIRFATLADEDSPQLRRRLHRLVARVMGDVPTPEPMRPPSYATWERSWLDAPFASPATLALALVADRPIAFSYIVMEADGSGYNWGTGVTRSHRGHGLGLAIKVDALRLAKERGVPFVRTNNDLTNAPMLAVNGRLGYQLRPGVIEFERVLRSSPRPASLPGRPG